MQHQSSDGAALLRAICDNPEDDTPRLVYADWLDEQGGESDIARAEFIRLQVAEAAKPVTWLNDRPMTPREFKLFRDWAHPTWREEIPSYTGLGFYDSNYERGFIYHMFARSVRSFLKAAPDLYTRAPITQVRFHTITPKTAVELARSPAIARIRYLDQLNGISDDALVGLATSPHLGNLTRVVFSDHELTQKGMRPFLANTSLTRLKDLNVHNCVALGSAVVLALVESPAASALEKVSMDNCRLGPDAALHLPALVRLPKLRSVDLSHNHELGDEAAICLAGASASGSLSISLTWTAVTDRGADALLSGPFLRNSQVKLQLAMNQISDSMKAKLKEAFGDSAII
jgi:uncharacterized protein (TIGR02996 family)